MSVAFNLGEEVDNPKCTFRAVENVYEVKNFYNPLGQNRTIIKTNVRIFKILR
jgi:hypothetical protein